jgi:hypothetical protein
MELELKGGHPQPITAVIKKAQPKTLPAIDIAIIGAAGFNRLL